MRRSSLRTVQAIVSVCDAAAEVSRDAWIPSSSIGISVDLAIWRRLDSYSARRVTNLSRHSSLLVYWQIELVQLVVELIENLDRLGIEVATGPVFDRPVPMQFSRDKAHQRYAGLPADAGSIGLPVIQSGQEERRGVEHGCGRTDPSRAAVDRRHIGQDRRDRVCFKHAAKPDFPVLPDGRVVEPA
jgi:hypothetical protein